MNSEGLIFVGCIVVLVITFLYASEEVDSNRIVRYNCELSEVSPDFPKEVKQKCREIKNENRSMQ